MSASPATPAVGPPDAGGPAAVTAAADPSTGFASAAAPPDSDGAAGRAAALELRGITRSVGGRTHLYPIDLRIAPGSLTVLLGVTAAGKTSLMRVMAGLDRPDDGRVFAAGRDVTGVPVRQRDVAMVYQQFINYPSMNVFDNIASPMRLKPGGRDAAAIAARVRDLAARLHIDHLLDRLPSELSGGQQQRVALARALAKQAGLVLLDEPLANLDYKLREELRDELLALFSTGRSSVVYATTEPAEALMLGGQTAVLDRGRLLQSGPAIDVYLRPATVEVARTFSDPPINLLPATVDGTLAQLPGGLAARLHRPPSPLAGAQPVTLGIRAADLSTAPSPGALVFHGRVELSEISGSDTYVHLHTPAGPLVMQRTGVHRHAIGDALTLYLDPAAAYVFDASGRLALLPARLDAAGAAAPAGVR